MPSPLPGDLPDQGIKPGSPELQADSLLSEPPGKPYAAAAAKSLQSCPTLQPHGLSMEFSRQDYCSGLPFSSPGDLPNPGIEPGSPTLQADSLPSEPPEKPR